ncbi:MAG: alpha/beta hydrolase, partial [Chloroflexota bacterium]
FGGGGTVVAALLAPERVESLVLVDVAVNLEAGDTEPAPPSPLLNGFFAVRPLRNAVIAATVTNPGLSRTMLETLILDPADATDTQISMLQQQLVIEDSTDIMGDWLFDFLTAHESSLSTDLAAYETLEMPTLIIWGDSDTVVPLSQGEKLDQLIPNSELVVLEQVNHIPHIEDSEGFNNALLGFLDRSVQ